MSGGKSIRGKSSQQSHEVDPILEDIKQAAGPTFQEFQELMAHLKTQKAPERQTQHRSAGSPSVQEDSGPYTALMEYLISKDPEWWDSMNASQRRCEIDEVIGALTRLNRALRRSAP